VSWRASFTRADPRDKGGRNRALSRGVGGCVRTEARAVEAAALGIGVAPEDTRPTTQLDARLVLALGVVWILWGSTVAGMRAAVASIPPFAMTSLRFTIAGLLLYAVCVLRGKAQVTRDDLVRATVTGATLLLFSNGITAWTVQFMPTGVNSLLLSLAPAWMVVFAYLWGRERPTVLTVVGMLIGFAGLALLLAPHGRGGLSIAPLPLALACFAACSWGFGSVAQRRLGRPDSLVLATALQMTVGGALIGIEAALFGQWQLLDVRAVSAMSWLGLAWLIVFGSIAGYSAYLYTMQRASAALAATYAYVNPVVAVILGIWLFHERFTPLEALASAIIVVGVALMMIPPRSAARTIPSQVSEIVHQTATRPHS